MEDLQTKMELTENYEFNGRPIAIVVTDPSQFERFRPLAKKPR